MQKTFQVKQADRTRMYPLGVSFEEEGLRISAVCEGAGEAGIILYDKRHREGAWVWRTKAILTQMSGDVRIL